MGRTHLLNLYLMASNEHGFGCLPTDLYCPRVTDDNFKYSVNQIVFLIGLEEKAKANEQKKAT